MINFAPIVAFYHSVETCSDTLCIYVNASFIKTKWSIYRYLLLNRISSRNKTITFNLTFFLLQMFHIKLLELMLISKSQVDAANANILYNANAKD